MCRTIFSINSGRAGSAYLAELLATAEETRSFHEAAPDMSGAPIAMANRLPYSATFSDRLNKCRAIERELAMLPADGVYCETNHTFITAFFDVVLHSFPSSHVILLRRELALVLKSYMELGYFGKNDLARHWFTSPNAVTAAIPCIDQDSRLDPYDRAIAHLIDIESRALRFRCQYPDTPLHEYRVEELSRPQAVERMFLQLCITPTEATWSTCGRIVNRRSRTKRRFDNRTTLDYCRRRITQYLDRAEAAGMSLPHTLCLLPWTGG